EHTVALDLSPRWTYPHPRIDAVRGTVALERGPLVYCLEEVDLPDGVALQDVVVSPDQAVTVGPGALELTGTAGDPGPADLHRPVERAAGGQTIRHLGQPWWRCDAGVDARPLTGRAGGSGAPHGHSRANPGGAEAHHSRRSSMKRSVRRRTTAAVSVAAVAALMLGACSGGGENGGGGDGNTVHILVTKHALTGPMADMAWVSDLEEMADVTIVWEEISSDWDQKKSTMLAA